MTVYELLSGKCVKEDYKKDDFEHGVMVRKYDVTGILIDCNSKFLIQDPKTLALITNICEPPEFLFAIGWRIVIPPKLYCGTQLRICGNTYILANYKDQPTIVLCNTGHTSDLVGCTLESDSNGYYINPDFCPASFGNMVIMN